MSVAPPRQKYINCEIMIAVILIKSKYLRKNMYVLYNE